MAEIILSSVGLGRGISSQRKYWRSRALSGLALAMCFLAGTCQVAMAGKKVQATTTPTTTRTQKPPIVIPTNTRRPQTLPLQYPYQPQPSYRPSYQGYRNPALNNNPAYNHPPGYHGLNANAGSNGNTGPNRGSRTSFQTAPGITRAPFHSGSRGMFGSLFQGSRGSRGYKSLSSFSTRGMPTTFRRDKATGGYELAVGSNLLDLGSPTKASIVAVQDFPTSQLTVMRASSPDCPVDYVAVDVSNAPYHNWHMGDCHTDLTFWTNGNQLFAESVEQDDGRTWVYSNGNMYGPLQKSAVFAGSTPPPSTPPTSDAESAARDSQPATDDATSPASSEPSSTDTNASASNSSSTQHSKRHDASSSVSAAVTPPAPQHLPRTALFDPSCLNGAPPVEAQNTPCTYTPGAPG
jgi:hypothetical protein